MFYVYDNTTAVTTERPRDLIHTHPNAYPYFITAIKHGYRCFISELDSIVWCILIYLQEKFIFFGQTEAKNLTKEEFIKGIMRTDKWSV